MKKYLYSMILIILLVMGVNTGKCENFVFEVIRLPINDMQARQVVTFVQELPDPEFVTTPPTSQQWALSEVDYDKGERLLAHWRLGRLDDVVGMQRGLLLLVQAAEYDHPMARCRLGQVYENVQKYFLQQGNLDLASKYEQLAKKAGSAFGGTNWEITKQQMERRGITVALIRKEGLGHAQVKMSDDDLRQVMGVTRESDDERATMLTRVSSTRNKVPHVINALGSGLRRFLVACGGGDHAKQD